jgi:hypothetical protein
LIIPNFKNQLICKIILSNQLYALGEKYSFTTPNDLIGTMIIDMFYDWGQRHKLSAHRSKKGNLQI